ncbi:hypothetical protein BH11ARM1_BH11ARM1_04960 [soil metagenome]
MYVQKNQNSLWTVLILVNFYASGGVYQRCKAETIKDAMLIASVSLGTKHASLRLISLMQSFAEY